MPRYEAKFRHPTDPIKTAKLVVTAACISDAETTAIERFNRLGPPPGMSKCYVYCITELKEVKTCTGT